MTIKLPQKLGKLLKNLNTTGKPQFKQPKSGELIVQYWADVWARVCAAANSDHVRSP